MLTANELLKLACAVWGEFLGVAALPAAPDLVPSGDLVTGVVYFQAGGGVAVTLSRTTAQHLASKVFMIPADEVTLQDADDLTGDLATIFANNAAAHVHSTVRSNSVVVHDSGVPDHQLSNHPDGPLMVWLESQDQPVLIRLFKATA